jgi:hypothetical protein
VTGAKTGLGARGRGGRRSSSALSSSLSVPPVFVSSSCRPPAAHTHLGGGNLGSSVGTSGGTIVAGAPARRRRGRVRVHPDGTELAPGHRREGYGRGPRRQLRFLLLLSRAAPLWWGRRSTPTAMAGRTRSLRRHEVGTRPPSSRFPEEPASALRLPSRAPQRWLATRTRSYCRGLDSSGQRMANDHLPLCNQNSAAVLVCVL